jgi:beta-barrel assembly-enhancing protease
MRALASYPRLLGALAAALCLASCAPAPRPAPAPEAHQEARREAEIQRGFAAESYYERLDRLNAVAWPLVTANEPLCRQRGKARPSLGLVADSFNRRDNGQWAQALCALWGVGEDTAVITGVMPGGPAARAGVRRGDVLRSAGGKPVDLSGKTVDVSRRLDELAAAGPVSLELLRAGRPVSVTIPAPVEVCDTRFTVVVGDAVNAFADGKSVFATYGAMNLFAKDEDLAVVLGHELAHNILGHVRQDASGKAVGSSSPEAEAEADAVGLYFTARAGFGIADAPRVWRRLAAQNPAHISAGGDHPSTAARFLSLEAVRDEILMRQAAGLPLIPRPRVAP